MSWHIVAERVAPRLLAGLSGAALALLVDVGLLDARLGRAAAEIFSGSSLCSPEQIPSPGRLAWPATPPQ